MEKYLLLFIIFIILFYFHKCWIENLIKSEIKKETFSNSAGSGMDDSTAIQALGSIAKDLMSGGGLKIQGDSSFASVANFAKDVKVTGQLNASNILLSKGWSGFPDNRQDGAEIANDTGAFKTLMLVGNKSAGGLRQVGVWDALTVNGTLAVKGAGTIDTDLNIGGNIKIKGKGMRFFSMSVVDNVAIPVKDPAGRTYPTSEWVCCVQGFRMDWGGRNSGALHQFCFQKNGLWHIRSEAEQEIDSAIPTILAIPKEYFDNISDVPNGPGFLGGW